MVMSNCHKFVVIITSQLVNEAPKWFSECKELSWKVSVLVCKHEPSDVGVYIYIYTHRYTHVCIYTYMYTCMYVHP